MKTSRASFFFATADDAASAFYSAFEMCDLHLMEAVWASENTSCIHPRSLPFLGRDEVLESWKHILSHANPPVIQVEVIEEIIRDDMVIHVVIERLAENHQPDAHASTVLATNVYVREKAGWRIAQHHASSPPAIEAFESEFEVPTTLQ